MTATGDSPLKAQILPAALGVLYLIAGAVFVVQGDDRAFGTLLLLAGFASVVWAGSERFASLKSLRRVLRGAGYLLSAATIAVFVLVVL